MKKIELLAMLGESKDIIDYLQRKGTVQVEKCDAPESMYYTDTDSTYHSLKDFCKPQRTQERQFHFIRRKKRSLLTLFAPKEVEAVRFLRGI